MTKIDTKISLNNKKDQSTNKKQRIQTQTHVGCLRRLTFGHAFTVTSHVVDSCYQSIEDKEVR